MNILLYDNLPQFILLTIVLIFFLIFLYIKLAFPFWNVQPVYHPYDFWRSLYKRPFRIHHRFHPKVRTKYTKPDVLKTIPFVDCSQDDKKAFVNMLQCYSLADEDALFMFHLENLEAYFGGHLFASYLSFYKEIFYTVKKKNHVIGQDEWSEDIIVREDKPRGCISSRSGGILVGGHNEPVYYIDFMTTVRGLPNDMAIHREMFDTHMYNVGLAEWREEIGTKEGSRVAPIGVGLFKRTGILLDGIMPFVRFNRRVYEIPNNPEFFKCRYPEHVVLVEICAANMRKMTDGLERGSVKFGIYGTTDMSNLIGLIKAGVIYVYILERLGEVLAMYFFRDTRIQMEGAVLELADSIYIGGSVGLFQQGFKGAVGYVIKKNSVYRRLCIEDISDNVGLDLLEWYGLGSEKGAYYLFNLVVPTSSVTTSAFLLF